MYKVYQLISPSNKMYIGFTSMNLKKRLQDHNYEAHKRQTSKIHKAICKYPLKDWQINVLLETHNRQLALQTEINMIKYYNTIKEGYNISTGGEHAALGVSRSEETKRRISQTKKLHPRVYTEEQRAQQSLRQTGTHQPQCQKEKVAKALAQTWRIILPNGQTEIIINLNQYCKQHNLQVSNMCWVAKGKLTQTKGYKCERINTT